MNESAAPQATPSLRKRNLLIGLAAVGGFLAMGVPMLSMMVFMGQMTRHMGHMVEAVDRMAGDVSVRPRLPTFCLPFSRSPGGFCRRNTGYQRQWQTGSDPETVPTCP